MEQKKYKTDLNEEQWKKISKYIPQDNLADGAYNKSGVLSAWLLATHQCCLEIAITLRNKGFNVVPKRWIIERTFGWLLYAISR